VLPFRAGEEDVFLAPRTAALSEGARAARPVYPGKLGIWRSTHLAPDQQAVEAQAARYAEEHTDDILRQYEQRFGRQLIDADLMKELLPGYAADKARHATSVHGPSSVLADLAYERWVQDLPPGSRVMLTAGGPASGKTTTIKGIPAALTYDTTSSDPDMTARFIQQATGLEHPVTIVYVHTPADEAARRMLQRAAAGEGRVVPAEVLADKHVQAQHAFLAIENRFKDDPRVEFIVLDNGGAHPRPLSLATFQAQRYTDPVLVRQQVREAIDDAYDRSQATAHPIPERFYRAALGGSTDGLPGETTVAGIGGERPQNAGESAGSGTPGPARPLSIGEILQRARQQAGLEPPPPRDALSSAPAAALPPEPQRPISVSDILSAARRAKQAEAEAEQALAAPPEATSPGALIRAVRNREQANQTLADLLKQQRGAVVSPLIDSLARGGVGGAIGYALPANTQEERLRNAAIGAGAAIGGPILISRFFKGGEAAKAASPLEQMVKEIGDAARKVEYGADTGDFRLAHAVADEALRNLEQLKAQIGDVTPDNRLFRVVANTLLPEGAEKARNLETVSGAARVLQRYSDLAQKLSAMAQQGDQEAGQLLNTLFGGQDANLTRKIVNFWRGSLTGRVATGIRNALDQGMMLATSMLDRITTGVVEGFRTGHPIQETAQGLREAWTLGSTAARRLGQGLAEFTHLAAGAPRVIDRVMDAFPQEKLRLFAKPEGLEGLPGKYLEYANKVNEVQEGFFRRVIAEAELRNGLQRAGIDPDQALANPSVIPDGIMATAVDRALKGTLAYKPDGRLGKAVALFFSDVPEAHLIVPFPRYMANRMQYLLDHSPLGLVRLATVGAKRGELERVIAENTELLSQGGQVASKAQFNIERAASKLGRLDSNSEIIGKALTGTIVPLAAGLTLRNNAFAGEHWWEVKDGEKRLDFRPYATLAGFMFLGELAKELLEQGKITMSREDITQGLGVLGTRAGVGLTVLDMLSGRGDVSFDGVVNLAADLAAMVPSGFFNPISQSKDILAGLGSEPEAIQRDLRDTPAMRLYGPTLNQIPVAERYLPERYSPTSAGPVKNEFPIARFFGMNVTTPNAVEQEIARLGISRQSLYPHVQDKAIQRAMLQRQGPFVEQMGGRVVSSPGYTALPQPMQQMTIKRILESGRKVGLAGLTPEQIRTILLFRQPPEIRALVGAE
jgi:hypothetical protein